MNYEEKKEILREAARIATKVINERLPGNMFIPSITLRKAIDKEVDRPWHEGWDEQTREKWGITPNSFQRDWDSKKAQELHDEREREKYELYKAQQKEISNLESYFHGPQSKTYTSDQKEFTSHWSSRAGGVTVTATTEEALDDFNRNGWKHFASATPVDKKEYSSHWHNLEEGRIIRLSPEAQRTHLAYGNTVFTVILKNEKDVETFKEFMSTKAPEHKVKYTFCGLTYEVVAKTKQDLDFFTDYFKGILGDPYDMIATKMGLTQTQESHIAGDVWKDRNSNLYKKDEFGFHKI